MKVAFQNVLEFPLQIRRDVPLTTPHIDKVLTQFHQQIASEAVTAPVAQPELQSIQPIHSAVTNPADPINEERIKKLEQQVSQLIKRVHILQCSQN